MTEDADLLLDDAEVRTLVEEANLGEALEKTNRELEPRGLYVTHIWGPEQEILTPTWRERCRPVPEYSGRLKVSVLGPLDLIASKLGRLDDVDLADVLHLMAVEHLGADEVLRAVSSAVAPPPLADTFADSLVRLEAALRR
jgi:hypothetical protein